MTTELESEIRDALQARAASITPTSLRHARASRRRLMAPRVLWPVLAAAAVVAALAAVIAIQPWRAGHSESAAGRGQLPAANTTWTLVRADSPDGSIVAGNDLRASLTFDARGHVLGNDGVNTTDATYVPIARGFRVYPIGTTAAGYAGHDRRVLEVISAMGALFQNVLTGSVDVASQLHGDRLTLQANGYILQFVRAG